MIPVEKVLIIEDEVQIAKMIADHFIAAGFVKEVNDNKECGYALCKGEAIPKKVRTIKVRWIESTTEKSVLVMTKKQKWFWIPISVISDLNRTSKGNWKIVVYDYFKEKEIVVKNHLENIRECLYN